MLFVFIHGILAVVCTIMCLLAPIQDDPKACNALPLLAAHSGILFPIAVNPLLNDASSPTPEQL